MAHAAAWGDGFAADAVFAALADATRRRIVDRLMREGERTVGELASPFSISLPAISRHLKVLERAGLVRHRVERQWRVYAAQPETLRQVGDWVAAYRDHWNTAFDRLETALGEGTRIRKGTLHD
jgi:DNA-binding transcriptional ArsR family regulator